MDATPSYDEKESKFIHDSLKNVCLNNKKIIKI